jgi:hypothetical protein
MRRIARAVTHSKAPILDKAFIEKLRHELTKLRDELLLTTQASETEEAKIRSPSLDQAMPAAVHTVSE